jgi:hypothetical protein
METHHLRMWLLQVSGHADHDADEPRESFNHIFGDHKYSLKNIFRKFTFGKRWHELGENVLMLIGQMKTHLRDVRALNGQNCNTAFLGYDIGIGLHAEEQTGYMIAKDPANKARISVHIHVPGNEPGTLVKHWG